ncbi:hypothetical protein CDIK_2768 [Cucumispora dikerogammari]|nr:hypothetical protein CDIK_2768 [Cucumispora dikerogammari]
MLVIQVRSTFAVSENEVGIDTPIHRLLYAMLIELPQLEAEECNEMIAENERMTEFYPDNISEAINNAEKLVSGFYSRFNSMSSTQELKTEDLEYLKSFISPTVVLANNFYSNMIHVFCKRAKKFHLSELRENDDKCLIDSIVSNSLSLFRDAIVFWFMRSVSQKFPDITPVNNPEFEDICWGFGEKFSEVLYFDLLFFHLGEYNIDKHPKEKNGF